MSLPMTKNTAASGSFLRTIVFLGVSSGIFERALRWKGVEEGAARERMFKIKIMTSILLLTFELPPLVVDCCIAVLGFQKPSPKNSATTFKPMDFLKPAARRVGSRKKASVGRLIDAAAAISQAHASLLAISDTVVLPFFSRRNKKNQCFRSTEDV